MVRAGLLVVELLTVRGVSAASADFVFDVQVTSTPWLRRSAPSLLPSGSLSTVSVTWFDRDAVWRAVEAHARALAARCTEIEEIRVFASLVNGTAVPGSDVDLLIVVSASDRPFPDRIRTYLPGAFPCGVDVFPYTRAEITRMTSEGNTLVAAALREGRTIFKRVGR